MKYIIIFITIILSASSCNTLKITTIDVRKPANVTFPSNVTDIIVVDNTPKEKTSKGENKLGDIPIIKLDSAKSVMLSHLGQFMNGERYFNKVEIYPYRTNGSVSQEVSPLSTRKIQSICHESNANALISVDMFTVSGELDTESTGYLSSYRIIAAKLGALVRVYSEDGNLYSAPIVLLDSLYREENLDWSKINSSIPPLNDLIVELSVLAADHLTGKFIPSWQQQDRWYYVNNSSKMKEAAKYAEQSKWKEAVDIWKILFEIEKNTKKKIQLSSNIALACEYLDEIDNAVIWINTAYNLLPPNKDSDLSNQITTYKNILEKRQNVMPLLYKQLGIDENKEDSAP